jgi:hypothetical protein
MGKDEDSGMYADPMPSPGDYCLLRHGLLHPYRGLTMYLLFCHSLTVTNSK